VLAAARRRDEEVLAEACQRNPFGHTPKVESNSLLGFKSFIAKADYFPILESPYAGTRLNFCLLFIELCSNSANRKNNGLKMYSSCRLVLLASTIQCSYKSLVIFISFLVILGGGGVGSMMSSQIHFD
jgi:hypothetical protein